MFCFSIIPDMYAVRNHSLCAIQWLTRPATTADTGRDPSRRSQARRFQTGASTSFPTRPSQNQAAGLSKTIVQIGRCLTKTEPSISRWTCKTRDWRTRRWIRNQYTNCLLTKYIFNGRTPKRLLRHNDHISTQTTDCVQPITIPTVDTVVNSSAFGTH